MDLRDCLPIHNTQRRKLSTSSSTPIASVIPLSRAERRGRKCTRQCAAWKDGVKNFSLVTFQCIVESLPIAIHKGMIVGEVVET